VAEVKNVLPEKITASFAIGTRKLYDFVDDNPLVTFAGSDFVNDPLTIARNDDVVAVNAAIQVDLTGQVHSDSMGTHPYSGIGSQLDFIRGAARSRAGVVTSRGDVHTVATEYGIASLHAKGVHERAGADTHRAP
jgi:4-hydroxybutyrate CoA-transferase